MGFSDFSSSVKLNNIKAYGGINTANNDAFKKQIYSDIEEIDYGSYNKIDYNEIDLQEGIEVEKNEKEWYEVAGATACVTVTSVASGILKLYEYADDGVTWLRGMVASGVARIFQQNEFAEKLEEKVMYEIARDKVGEINEFFYKNTELGKTINDASSLKYDSELAQSIQDVTTEAVIIAGATAATVATGGAAAPLFAVGFVVGAGESAEKNYQDKENRDFWKDSAEIAVDGTIKGLSTMAYGKAGATAVNGVKTLGKLGLSGVKELGKQALGSISKESLKQTAKQSGKIALKTAGQTLIDKDTWRETGVVLLDDVKLGMQTGQWDVLKMVGDAGLIYGENYVGNLMTNLTSDILYKMEFNATMDSKTSHEKSQSWKSYYEQKYGADVVEHISGIDVDGSNGLVVDPSAATINRIMDATLGKYSLSEFYTADQVIEGVRKFELEYPGYTVTDIKYDLEFREMLLDQYTINSASETAVLGKWKPSDDCFSYIDLANDPNFNSTYFEYGDRASALEGVLGTNGTSEYLNRPYLENIISEAQNGNKRIILTTGPNSVDWGVPGKFYTDELFNIADILGLNGIDELATYLKSIEVEVNGVKGIVYEIDFDLLNS